MNDKSKLFAFRPGVSLLNKLEQVKEALGLSSSDAARTAMEKGAQRILQERAGISDKEELRQLQCNVRGTLLTLLRKEKAGNELTRAEWGFLARFCNETYDRLFRDVQVIDRELLIANMRAFAAVLKVRDQIYPSLANTDEDRYYFSNMGFSWVDRSSEDRDIHAHVEACIKGLPEYPSVGSGVFPSRNFDVALRDEPWLDIGKLNSALHPYLNSLLLVCLRGYWQENKTPIITSLDKPDGWRKTEKEQAMPTTVYLNSTKNEFFCLSSYADETTISCAIESFHHPFIFALNNFVELTSFQALIERVGHAEKHVSIPGFEINLFDTSRSHKLDRYMLVTGRWRHFFDSDEFEALKDVLNKFFEDTEVKNHLQKLEMIYGRV